MKISISELKKSMYALIWCYRRTIIPACTALTLAGLLLCASLLHPYLPVRAAGSFQQEIAGKILRFHVIADSDSPEDQAVKLRVRDAVTALLEEPLAQAESLEETERIVEGYLDKIEETADAVLRENGFTCRAEAELSDTWFPRKSYGELTFPAGNYRALRVRIGRAAGQNWWCVLFPNLCFIDSIHAVAPEASEQKLKNVLTEEEYESLFDYRESEVRYRFPIVEKLCTLFQ